ncbi:serine protease gd-like [Lutzomyia longipalpis]|uniref:serine protease gd-like n=1 Tax=Lutzomyia longipalpis TaxID=7200 RepID=UPI0024836684|nr:serine protease gd-like [Lutzomyia longipalpis]
MITSVKCIVALVHTVVVFSVVRGQQVSSPCPNLFQYQHNGYEPEGALEVPAPPIGTKLELHVFLTVPAQLPSSYVGALELRDSQDVALQRLRNGLPVRYRVKFPIPNPVPRLVSITYNGNVICQGENARYPHQGSYVTNIRLDHMLTTKLSNQPFYETNPYQQPPPTPTYHDPFSEPYPTQNNYFQNNTNPFFDKGNQYDPYGGSNNFIPQAPAVDPTYPSYQQPQQPQPIPTKAPPPSPLPQRPSNTRPTNPFIQQNTNPPYQTAVNRYGGESGNNVCGKIDSRFTITPLIYGGEEFPKGSWPWLVAVHVYKGAQFSFVCGGTLVSHNVIVSAAHCFTDGRGVSYQATDVIVFVGKHDLRKLKEDGATISEVSDLNIHPEFLKDPQGSFDADIAVLVLKESVEFSTYIRPACLWSLPTDEEYFVGKTGVVVGWGRDEKGNLVTYLPKRTQVPLVSSQECINSRDDFAVLTSARTICGGWRDGVNGPCTGDSGGGLIMYENGRWQLRGVISIAIKHPVSGVCDLREYVVFTDAAKFTSWIRSFMR